MRYLNLTFYFLTYKIKYLPVVLCRYFCVLFVSFIAMCNCVSVYCDLTWNGSSMLLWSCCQMFLNILYLPVVLRHIFVMCCILGFCDVCRWHITVYPAACYIRTMSRSLCCCLVYTWSRRLGMSLFLYAVTVHCVHVLCQVCGGTLNNFWKFPKIT